VYLLAIAQNQLAEKVVLERRILRLRARAEIHKKEL
jgi:hypothetical protein